MEYEQLSKIYHDEQTRDNLTLLEPGFYDDVAGLVKKLNDERRACDNYHERERLDDLIKNIRVMFEGINDRRQAKIVLALSSSVPENMTPVEQEAYEGMSAMLAGWRVGITKRLDEAFAGGKA